MCFGPLANRTRLEVEQSKVQAALKQAVEPDFMSGSLVHEPCETQPLAAKSATGTSMYVLGYLAEICRDLLNVFLDFCDQMLSMISAEIQMASVGTSLFGQILRECCPPNGAYTTVVLEQLPGMLYSVTTSPPAHLFRSIHQSNYRERKKFK